MERDSLETLLRRADRTAGASAPPSDLAERARTAARRRRVMGRSLSAVAAAIVLAVGGWAFWQRSAEITTETHELKVAVHNVKPSTADVQAMQAELEALRKEVAWREELIRMMLAERAQQTRLASLERELAKPMPDPRVAIHEQVERAAETLVDRANRLLVTMDSPDAAIAGYRDVLRLYPETTWAEVARRRLTEIESKRSS